MSSEMSIETSDDFNLDSVLTEVGEFGPFQVITFLLICIPNIISATWVVNYMISANTLDYRCKVPGCDIGENNREIAYDQSWVKNAIPSTNGKIDNCFRYIPMNETKSDAAHCSAGMFDTSRELSCSEFIYATNERNIQTEFNIHCADSYKLALVGSVNNIGRFLMLPFTGLLSDKYGRLTVMVVGMVLSSICGIIKTFSINYPMYLAFEFLESSTGASNFESSYVLCIEWVNSSYRVLGSTIITIAFSLGEMLLGLVAMFVPDFRTFSQIFYIPGLFVISYFWLVPESVRWLLVTGRVDQAIKDLKRIGKINGKELSDKSIYFVRSEYTGDNLKNRNGNMSSNNESYSVIKSFCEIFKSKALCLRFLNCSYQWAACCLGYFGLSLSATHIPGANRYISYIFVVSAEIPGVLISQVLLKRIKRRTLIASSICTSAISIIISSFIPEDYSVVVLLLFLLGKAAMSCAWASLFVYTAEQWPTNIRTTIMNTCLMVGRVGSMVAPFAVALDAKIHSFLALLIGGSAIFAAILVLFSPETFSRKLPDTVREAKDL